MRSILLRFVAGFLFAFLAFSTNAAVTPASLPLTLVGYKSVVTESNGFTFYGLGDDYDSGGLRFDDSGDWLLLQLAEYPGLFSCKVQSNNCGVQNQFEIQYSKDGVSFETFSVCNHSGTEKKEVSYDLTSISGIRYIRWIYTKKVFGNYGLSDVSIAKKGIEFGYGVDSDLYIIGSSHTFPQLYNSYGTDVTYTSSNINVANIDNSGNVTVTGRGETTITATTTLSDGSKQSSSYLLSVRKQYNEISFDKPSGTYLSAPVSVSLSASVEGTKFFYTTDGSEPTVESAQYGNPIDVTVSGTKLKVLAINADAEDATVSGSYIIQPEKPLFDKESQTFAKMLDVSLSLPSSTTATSKIYYAVNEHADATKTLYGSSPITLSGSGTEKEILALHAVVVDGYGNVGAEGVVEYTFDPSYNCYKKVTGQSEIVDGGEYLIVCENSMVAMNTELKSSNHMESSSVTITDGLINTLEDIAVTLVRQSDGIYNVRLSTNKYLAWNSTTQLQLLSSINSTNMEKASWSISVDNDANVVMKNRNSFREIRLSSNSDFRAYSQISSGFSIQLYKKVTSSSSLNLRAKGSDESYYATFSNTKDVVFGNDVTVSTVYVTGGGLRIVPLSSGNYSVSTIDKSEVQNGFYVPANTGVLLKTSIGSINYYTPFEKQDVTVDTSNQLVAVSENGVFEGKEGYRYYKLAYDNTSLATGLGFYWGADNGAPFKVVSGLAYLAVPVSTDVGVKSGFLFSETAKVGVVGAETKDMKMFTLSGQRVNVIKGRGVYIVNGKKVVRH